MRSKKVADTRRRLTFTVLVSLFNSSLWAEQIAMPSASLDKDKIFSITNVWNDLIEKKELYGFETNNNFYHLTDLETFKKLKDL